MEPLNEHFLKVHEIFSKFQTEIEWNEKKQIRGCFSIEVISKYPLCKSMFLGTKRHMYVLGMHYMYYETQKVICEMCQSNITLKPFSFEFDPAIFFSLKF